MDAAHSILRSLPGRVVGGGDDSPEKEIKVPYIVGAFVALDRAVERLERSASLKSWWEVNGSVSLPGAASGPALRDLVSDVKAQGYATPEQIETAVHISEDLIAAGYKGRPLRFEDFPAGAAEKIHSYIKEMRGHRATLQREPSVPARDRGRVRGLEKKCAGYTGVAEKCSAVAASYIERVAAALEKAVEDS